MPGIGSRLPGQFVFCLESFALLSSGEAKSFGCFFALGRSIYFALSLRDLDRLSTDGNEGNAALNDKWQMADDEWLRLCRNKVLLERDAQDKERGPSCRALNSSSVIYHLSFVILLISLSLAGKAFGDGGSVQLHSVSGPFEITLFAEPPLPRAGQNDFSVLIQDAKSGQPVLDATVVLALTAVQVHQKSQPAWYPPSCAVSQPANLAAVPLLHSGASNRLLYGAVIEVPAAGVWQARASVQRGDEHASIEGNVDVADPFPPVANYWPLFLFPVVAIGLYVLRAVIAR
jgi:hypothetical protein